MKYNLLSLVFLVLLTSLTPRDLFAQGTVTGKVVDATTKEPLPGATVILKGTEKAAPTTLDGTFTLQVDDANASAVLVNYVGYMQKEVSIAGLNGKKNLGTILLEPNVTSINEVLITANSYAIDRETPVAISTITSEIITEKASNQEFPELLKSTPGVYATKQGGGFGDSRINLRGFKNANIAVMINGVPVNDMENGSVYWSNWAGLTDVTKSMQVQRGLGASKVAVPSIGGTINIITKTTDATKGGSVFYGIGNDGYNKVAFTYSTGLTEDGWAFAASGSKTEGNGWADGLQFEAYNYFFNVSKLINKNHTISLTGFGAPQWHGQRQTRKSIQEFRDAPQGIKWNPDWGVLNGEKVSVEDNFYHKPQFSLNHYWTIDENSFLSTALYASVGTGGGGAFTGVLPRTGNAYSPYDLDAAVEANTNSADGHALTYLRASRNDHNWYGALSTYQKSLNEKINLLAGLDLRYYKGKHFTEVTDLLGAEYVLDQSNVNNPNNRATVGDKINYYNDGVVLWEGGFLQGEYSSGPLSAFVSLAASNTSYKRIDHFLYEEGNQETDFQHFFGYQAKGGANYNLNENHNVFANLGYFEKAPFFNAVFLNNQNVVNPDAQNEKILSYELGYGYRTSKLNANINLYRTNWRDRSFTQRFPGQESGSFFFANILGVDALHQGVEVDFSYMPTDKLTIRGMASFGDWEWNSNLDEVTVTDETQTISKTIGPLYMEGLKVGDAAQTTAALGVDYKVFKELKVGVDYNYYGDFYSEFDPTTLDKPGLTPWKVPNYSLLDLNAVFKIKIAGLDASLYANVNNVLNTEYISDAQAVFETVNAGTDNERTVSNAANSTVFYGIGRTWTTGLKINF
ncbi:TonB-dependent receptor [Pontibacter actiniarum]|uniref:TonB-dependent receptor n=1 Tax=Pontibacter actiniarum TaxID=323450 RepID=A0A1X9YU20_9BACT|nr:TonB-dependent receptor [Pontibacter actiniarum]ARS36358.1 TonB-dependent receptor [Pontibacter actiniarum]